MAELAVVRRYARALFETANRAQVVDKVETDLRAVDQRLRSIPRIQRALRIPTVSAERKKHLLTTAFGDSVGPLTLRFLGLLVDHRRETVLGDIYAEYQRLANEARNILPVEVTAAVPLTDAERDQLGLALAQRTGKRVILNVNIDPALMGGVVLRMGDTIIDGSVRSRLAQLKSRLMSWRVT